jgi:hypothetical protein
VPRRANDKHDLADGYYSAEVACKLAAFAHRYSCAKQALGNMPCDWCTAYFRLPALKRIFESWYGSLFPDGSTPGIIAILPVGEVTEIETGPQHTTN